MIGSKPIFLLFLSLITAVAAANDSTQDLPPKVIFHVGNKVHLLENAKFGNVPQAAWDQFIMGKETRYGLVPYRRGLYGSDKLDSLELYGNLYIGTPQIPWFMEIHIKDECRNPKVVTSIFDDRKYHKWLLANADYIIKNANQCLNMLATDCDDLLTGFKDVANGAEENACDAFLGKYLLESGSKIVKDTGWRSSWYIRDRDCIENIKASPKDVLRALSEISWDWASRKTTYSASNGYGMSTFAILVDALASSNSVDKKILEKLRQKTENSDIRISFHSEPPRNNPSWVREIAPVFIDAYDRCSKKSQLKEFKILAAEFQVDMQKENTDSIFGYLDLAQQAADKMKSICLKN